MGSVWIAPEGEPMDSFPDGWRELGVVYNDGYLGVDLAYDHIYKDKFLGLPTTVEFTMELDPENAKQIRKLLEGLEMDEE